MALSFLLGKSGFSPSVSDVLCPRLLAGVHQGSFRSRLQLDHDLLLLLDSLKAQAHLCFGVLIQPGGWTSAQ